MTTKSNQRPETITYIDNRKEITMDMFAGMGATQGVGSDSYPFTVWSWRVTKGGKLIIEVTEDTFAPKYPEREYRYGDYVELEYTSNEPSVENPTKTVKVGQNRNHFYLGNRRYYQDPSF